MNVAHGHHVLCIGHNFYGVVGFERRLVGFELLGPVLLEELGSSGSRVFEGGPFCVEGTVVGDTRNLEFIDFLDRQTIGPSVYYCSN